MSQTNGPGRKSVLNAEEESMIVERLRFAARRGFAVDRSGIKRIMAGIACDGRQDWRNVMPSDETVRAFRARHREITIARLKIRNAQN